jgi:hypothetical protein
MFFAELVIQHHAATVTEWSSQRFGARFGRLIIVVYAAATVGQRGV